MLNSSLLLQVDKSGLITGTRLGAERELDFDGLEVCPCGALIHAKLPVCCTSYNAACRLSHNAAC